MTILTLIEKVLTAYLKICAFVPDWIVGELLAPRLPARWRYRIYNARMPGHDFMGLYWFCCVVIGGAVLWHVIFKILKLFGIG